MLRVVFAPPLRGRARWLAPAIVLSVLGAAAPREVPAGPGAPSAAPRVELLRPPAGGLQPQAVVDSRGVLHLVYLRGEPRAADVYYTTRGPGEAGWGTPQRVNSEPGSAVAAGTIRGAQMALGRAGRVHVVWNGSNAASQKPPLGGAPMLYSRRDGEGFSPQRNLMQRTMHLDGGASVAADERGSVYAAWHGAPPDGKNEGDRALWIARSLDDGATFSPEQAAWKEPTGACACCGVRAYADAGGAVHVLYRAAFGGGTDRGMFLLSAPAPGAPFRGGRLDRWEIKTCPMSSEVLARGPDGLLAAWETSGQVQWARVDPPGALRAMSVPTLVTPAGAPGGRKHPALAVNARGEVLLAWTEGAGWQRGGALAWQVFDRTGQPLGEPGRREGGIPVWGLPTAAARADGSFTVVH